MPTQKIYCKECDLWFSRRMDYEFHLRTIHQGKSPAEARQGLGIGLGAGPAPRPQVLEKVRPGEGSSYGS